MLIRTLIILAACVQFAASAGKKPNIIWIFSDDHSFQTIGAYGGRYQKLNPTPNIDRIANQGMRFDRCYVTNSICAPSRAVLLTGKHSHLNGKTTNRGEFNHNQMNFAKILQKNDYETAMIGKIHLAGKMQGFDYWDVLPGQGKNIRVEGYEIHMGQTTVLDEGGGALFLSSDSCEKEQAGLAAGDGRVWGTYLHGLFDNDELRDNFLSWVKGENCPEHSAQFLYKQFKERNYDILADAVEKHVNVSYILKTIGINY